MKIPNLRVWCSKWSNWTFGVGQKNLILTLTPSVVGDPTPTLTRYDCNPGWNNDATELWLQQSYSNLKTILFKYKVRLKGITGHTGTAPFTQLFVVLKNMSHAVKVIVSYQVIISTMFQCFNLVQFGEKFAAQKIIPNLKKVQYSTDRCATHIKIAKGFALLANSQSIFWFLSDFSEIAMWWYSWYCEIINCIRKYAPRTLESCVGWVKPRGFWVSVFAGWVQKHALLCVRVWGKRVLNLLRDRLFLTRVWYRRGMRNFLCGSLNVQLKSC